MRSDWAYSIQCLAFAFSTHTADAADADVDKSMIPFVLLASSVFVVSFDVTKNDNTL